MRLVFAAAARDDLFEIGDYIARDDPGRAVSFVVEIETKCRLLLDHPLAHPLVPRHAGRGLRRVPHGAYLIFYRVLEDRLEIVRVLHGARDLDALLD